MRINRPDPSEALLRLRERINHIFADTEARSARATSSETAAWSPRVDIAETPEEIVVSADLCGLDREEIQVEITGDTPDGIGANRMIGKTAVVIEDLIPNDAKGKVRVDREVWIAESDSGEIIKESSRVKVLRIDGTRLIVEQEKTAGDEPDDNSGVE